MKWWEKENLKFRHFRFCITKKECRKILLRFCSEYNEKVPELKLVQRIRQTKDADGWYDRGKIWIQLNSNTVEFLTLAHEFAHYLHDSWYPEAYARLPKGREHNKTFKTLLKDVIRNFNWFRWQSSFTAKKLDSQIAVKQESRHFTGISGGKEENRESRSNKR